MGPQKTPEQSAGYAFGVIKAIGVLIGRGEMLLSGAGECYPDGGDAPERFYAWEQDAGALLGRRQPTPPPLSGATDEEWARARARIEALLRDLHVAAQSIAPGVTHAVHDREDARNRVVRPFYSPTGTGRSAPGREARSDLRAPHTDEVFVIHGRHEAPKERVARFVRESGLRPVILEEEANGALLLEKLERFANVGHAISLMSPDDEGGLVSDGTRRKRARQNVVFETGYFMRGIGRARVSALYWPEVELPSDLDGLAYIPWDEPGAWKIPLARDLARSFPGIDLHNLLMGGPVI